MHRHTQPGRLPLPAYRCFSPYAVGSRRLGPLHSPPGAFWERPLAWLLSANCAVLWLAVPAACEVPVFLPAPTDEPCRMLHQSIPAFCLQTDTESGLLRIEYQPGSGSGLRRPDVTALLALAHEYAIRHLLIDMRTIPLLTVYDELWLGTHFMPALVAMPLQRLVLIIGSHQTYHQLAVDALHDLVKPAIRFDAQYFDDPTTALGWLTDDSPRVPALLSEWAGRAK